MADGDTLATQALTVGAGVGGGAIGFFLSGGKVLWTAIGAFVAAVAVPPLTGLAGEALASINAPRTIQLFPGTTKIYRARIGDEITVAAPSGWGPPSANANIPGFLEIESTDTNDETTTVKVLEGGQGQIQMTSGGQTAVLSIEVVA